MASTQHPSARLRLDAAETYGLVEDEYTDRPIAYRPDKMAMQHIPTLQMLTVSASGDLHLPQQD